MRLFEYLPLILGIFYLCVSKRPGVRIGSVLLLISGALLYIIGAPPGILPTVILVTLIRELGRSVRGLPRTTVPVLLFVTAFLLGDQPSGYTLKVIGGLALYFLVSGYISNNPDWPVLGSVLAGSLIFAGYVLSLGATPVPERVNGAIVFINRSLPTGLDPNSSAGLALLGMGAALTLARRNNARRALPLVACAAFLAFFVATTAARYALVAALALLLLYLLAKGPTIGWRIFVVVVGIAVGVHVFQYIEAHNFLSRFAQLSFDESSRASIYSKWIRALFDTPQGLFFGLRESEITSLGVAPHNTILEAACHYGIVGVGLISWLVWRCRPRQSRVDAFRQISYAPLLGLASIIGMLSLYQPWIALALVWPRKRSSAPLALGIRTEDVAIHVAGLGRSGQ